MILSVIRGKKCGDSDQLVFFVKIQKKQMLCYLFQGCFLMTVFACR